MQGSGAMANFVEYSSVKLDNDSDQVKDFFKLDSLKYPLENSAFYPTIIIKQDESLADNSKTEDTPKIEQSTKLDNFQSKSPTTKIKYRGIIRDLNDVLETLHKNEPTAVKHYCTRAVSNALDLISNVNHRSGIADPRAMYKTLKEEGWTDVLDDNYQPQAGDIWTYYANDKKMHTSMFDGEKWMSYDPEGSNPWYFKHKADGRGHIQRYVHKGQRGFKFAKYDFVNNFTPISFPKLNFNDSNELRNPYTVITAPKINKQKAKQEIKQETKQETKQPVVSKIQHKPSPFFDSHRKDWFNFLKTKGLNNEDADRLSAFFTAQDGLESGNGTSRAAKMNNYGGMQSRGRNIPYSSKNEYFEAKYRMMNTKFPEALKARTPEEYVTILGDPVRISNGGYAYYGDPTFLKTRNLAYRTAQDEAVQKYVRGVKGYFIQ